MKIVWINIIFWRQRRRHRPRSALAAPRAAKASHHVWLGRCAVLRIVLTIVAAKLLELSFLQVVGGCLLLWIGYQLLTGEEDGEGESKGHGSMFAAIRTILIADLS